MLLPSSRESSGSNFFLFLLTVCYVGRRLLLLHLLFIIIRVIIFPDISFNKEIPQVHPYCCNQFKFHQMRATRVFTRSRHWSDQSIFWLRYKCTQCKTSPGWPRPWGPCGANRYPVTGFKWYDQHYQHRLDNTVTHTRMDWAKLLYEQDYVLNNRKNMLSKDFNVHVFEQI